jgi:hypothetical protein
LLAYSKELISYPYVVTGIKGGLASYRLSYGYPVI